VSPLAPLLVAALAMLPGLLVVRAPWTVVPALSLAFWALSTWWPPFAGLGRGRFLAGALAAFGALLVLRVLPKHEVPPPPGWSPPPAPPHPPRPGLPPPRLFSTASLVVVAAALAVGAPLPLWRNAPGPSLAFQTTTARLLVWRDAVPATAEPLLRLAPVGAHAPAVATLAADVSHVSTLDPATSVVVVVVAAAGLLTLGLFALHATWAPSVAAALGTVVGLAATPWPGALAPWGEGEALLALAFGLPAAALVLGHASRSSAVAAGMLLAASCLAAVVPAACTIAACLVPRASRSRAAFSGILAVALGAPGLHPLARALSPREAVSILLSVSPWDLLPSALGLGLCAFAPRLFLRLRTGSRGGRVAAAALAAFATVLLVARVHGWMASGQLSPNVRTALERVAAETGPLESVCAPQDARDWVPALAGRAAGGPGPWIPPVYADEWASRHGHGRPRRGDAGPGLGNVSPGPRDDRSCSRNSDDEPGNGCDRRIETFLAEP
jgi:hypothetical protein